MPPVHVAVAVIQDNQGRLLLSRRLEHVHQGGLWEFPGGKLEPGECLSRALKREIEEELGVLVLAHRPLISVTHHYPDKSVLLDVHRVTQFTGVPHGREGQAIAWVGLDEIGRYPLPAADVPILNALRLPEHYLITGQNPHSSKQFLTRLEQALNAGTRLVQLRAAELDPASYATLVSQSLECCQSYGAKLLLNAAVEAVQSMGADGVHLNSQRLMVLTERPLPLSKWVAASCHNLEELRQAEDIGADFAVLSPVLMTASHPEAPPVGWHQFSQWVARVSLPVFALGGMQLEMIQTAQQRGGQGIAGISGLWPVDS